MGKFLLKIALITFLFGTGVFLYHKKATQILSYYQGPNTAKQIDLSFEHAKTTPLDILIAGNSRLYRGIDPDQFNASAFNFAHDHDSYNQIYYKILYLKEHNISFKTLILGVDYFQFSVFSSKRNYAYAPHLNSNYLSDYPLELYQINPYENLRGIPMSYLIYKYTVRYYSNSPSKPLILKTNGQFITHGKSQKSYPNQKKRNPYRLPLQEKYFLKILDLCVSTQTKIVLTIPPTRPEELNAYSKQTLKEFDLLYTKLQHNYNLSLFNFSNDTTYSYKEYTDATHLNTKGAERYSSALNDSLITYDLSP